MAEVTTLQASASGVPVCIDEETQCAYRDPEVGETGSEYEQMCYATQACHGHMSHY